MSFPRKLLVLLLFLAACTTADRAVREPAPAEEPAPPAAAAVPEPQPVPPPVEEAREAEEEVEVVELPPPPPEAAATGSVVEVLFDAGGAALTRASRAVLDRLSDALPDGRSDYYLEIQGHADPSGSEELNLRISERRAEVVRTYLHRERGVPMATMGVVPLGSSAPTADNGTSEGRERNRRAVVVFLPPPA